MKKADFYLAFFSTCVICKGKGVNLTAFLFSSLLSLLFLLAYLSIYKLLLLSYLFVIALKKLKNK